VRAREEFKNAKFRIRSGGREVNLGNYNYSALIVMLNLFQHLWLRDSETSLE